MAAVKKTYVPTPNGARNLALESDYYARVRIVTENSTMSDTPRRDFLRQAAAAAVVAPLAGSAGAAFATPQEEADAFLARYVAGLAAAGDRRRRGDWAASTDVSEAHTAAQVARNLELNEFVGAPEVIDTVRRLLDQKDRAQRPDRPPAREGPPPRGRGAGDHPRGRQGPHRGRGQAVGRAGRVRLPHPARGEPRRTASANDIDRILVESRDLDERRAAWEASKDDRPAAPRGAC